MKKQKKKGNYLTVFSTKKKSVMANHLNDPMREPHPHGEELINRVAKKLAVAARSPEKNNLHIIARGEHWIVKREGAQKAYRICDTRAEAIQSAKELIERGTASSIIVHTEDGTVAKRIEGS